MLSLWHLTSFPNIWALLNKNAVLPSVKTQQHMCSCELDWSSFTLFKLHKSKWMEPFLVQLCNYFMLRISHTSEMSC